MHSSRPLYCRNVCKILLWSVEYILNQSSSNFGLISNSTKISLVRRGPGHYCVWTWKCLEISMHNADWNVIKTCFLPSSPTIKWFCTTLVDCIDSSDMVDRTSRNIPALRVLSPPTIHNSEKTCVSASGASRKLHKPVHNNINVALDRILGMQIIKHN